jgi:F-type H+-transporting ATPase subunit a
MRFFALSLSILATTLAGASNAQAAVSESAYKLTSIMGLPITNSMTMSWGVSIILIMAVRLMIGSKPSLVPSRSQAMIENLVEGVRNLIEPIVGKRMVPHVLPLLICFFAYILIQNWSGMIPGVGTIGHVKDGHFFYYLRPLAADLNATLALSFFGMGAWLYFVLRYAGIKALFYDLFGNKANSKEVSPPIYGMLFIIFFAVGLIEVISILFRPISLSLRLYGNIFGGENLLTNITGLVSWVVPVPFYFLELLVGLVQALVFTLLIAVYIGSICNHGEDHEHP